MYAPPFATRFLAPYVNWIEKQGNSFLPGLAGVLLIEVSKQVYARPVAKQAVRQTVRPPRFVKEDLIPLPGLGEPTPT